MEGSTKKVNFMTPGAGFFLLGCGHISNMLILHYFLKNLLLYSHAYIIQTQYIVMMTKEGSTKIANLKTPGAAVLVLGCGHISHMLKMHNFFKNLSSLLPVINQTKYIYSIHDQGRVYQNCKFHDPWGRGSCKL